MDIRPGECTMAEIIKLDLGCADKKQPGHIGMDCRDWGQEIVRDVSRGIPFSNETLDEVYTSHFMEHIERGKEIYFVMSEVYRVLKPGGLFKIRVPHAETPYAFYPDHLSYWNEHMVKALVEDPYQSYGDYKFTIALMKRSGIELQVVLKKI